MGYLVLAKAFFDIPIYGRMRAKTWMEAGCAVLLPSVEDAMDLSEKMVKNGVF